MYDPVVAVMLSPDRVSTDPTKTDDHNLFAYAWYNPLKYTDPTGWWEDWYQLDLGDGRSEIRYIESQRAREKIDGKTYKRIGEEIAYKNINGKYVYGFKDGTRIESSVPVTEIAGKKPGNPSERDGDYGQGTIDELNNKNYGNTFLERASNAEFWLDHFFPPERETNVQTCVFDNPFTPGGALKIGGLVNAVKALKFTKSNLQLGQQMHKAYKIKDVAKGIAEKEFRGIKGIRPDFVNFSTKTIYELKPHNPRAIQQGIRQLEKYKTTFELHYPGSAWKTVLDTY